MCRILGHQPSLGMFCKFYVNSYSNGWLSFSKRGLFPCCVSKNLDSLKNWNDHFFWIDNFVCPVFVPWYKDVSIKRDPLPCDDLVDLPLLDKLNDNHTRIRKYTETFLCLVSLRRSFVDMDAYMGLLDFVKSADPFKVKTRERTLADGGVPLLTETADMVKRKVGFSADELSMKKIRSSGVVILEPNLTTVGKREFASFSVTLTSEPEGYEDAGSPHDGNAQMCRASKRYVVLTSSSKHEDADTIVSPKTTSPKVGSPNPHMHIGVEDVEAGVVNETVNTYLLKNDADAASLLRNGAGASFLPRNEAGTSSSASNDRSPIDEFLSLGLLTPLQLKTYMSRIEMLPMMLNFLVLLNVNSAQHACMVFELRLRYEHEILARDKFEQNFVRSCEIVQQKDAEIVSLKAVVEKAEGEAAEVIRLLKRVFELEVVAITKLDEVASLTAQNVELSRGGSACHSIERLVDVRIVELNNDMDTKLYPHMLTIVAGRRWVIGHGLRLMVMKCSESSEYHSMLGKVISIAINKGIQEGLELEPGLSNLNETGKSSNPSVSQVSEASKKDLEDLFQKIYDEYFDSSKIMKSSTTNVKTSNVEIPSHEEEVFHEVSESFQGEYSSSSLNDDVQQCPEE
nr:transposase (putative), gypsy type [Tanacetum cinerariifolium]